VDGDSNLARYLQEEMAGYVERAMRIIILVRKKKWILHLNEGFREICSRIRRVLTPF
jgi:hypothetical protein